MEHLLTVIEVAEALRVPESWVYDKTRRKGPESIPHLRVGKYCRFKIEEVESWLKKNQNRS